LGIDLGGYNRTMARQGLDIFNIDIVFQEQRGEGMTEDMLGDFLPILAISARLPTRMRDRLVEANRRSSRSASRKVYTIRIEGK